MKNLLFSCCCALLLLTACSSNDDSPNVPLAKLQITHASPGNSGLDMAMDGLRVNNIPFNYLANTGYLDAYAGQRKFTAGLSGSSSPLVNQQIQLTAEKRYSMFLYDSGVKIKTLLLDDVFPATEASKAHIRFFHLAPDAPAVTIGYVSGGTFTPVFSNRSFETQATATQHQGFAAVAAATYTIEVRRASDNMVVFSRPGVPLSEGKIYTFYARGLINSVTAPLGAEVIINR